MNIISFNTNSQNYLSKLLSSSSFDLENREIFSVIKEPYDLNGTKYQIFPFKALTGYLPDPEKKDEPVLYTFFLLKTDNEIKEKYIKEVNNMKAGLEYQKDVIGAYHMNFVPSFKPFDQLSFSLGKMLEEDFFSGKNYKFLFHMATITQSYDIALIYLQLNSLNVFESKYPGETEVPFKI